MDQDTKDLVDMIKEVKLMEKIKPEVIDLLEQYGIAEKISSKEGSLLGAKFNNQFYVIDKEGKNYVRFKTIG